MVRETSDSSFTGSIPMIYDTFFLQNISAEMEYLNGLLSQLGASSGKLLDCGCGTGAHAERFAKSGYEVTALDVSQDMLTCAEKKHNHPHVTYGLQDLTKMQIRGGYSVAVSLSHVIGYQYSNDSVYAMLKNIYDALEVGGLFLFNFYHGPGVLPWKLSSRMKQVEGEHGIITRCSNAVNDLLHSLLYLEYYYLIEAGEKVETVTINEKMRYFSLVEMEYFLTTAGFEILDEYKYLTDSAIDENTWNGFVIAKRT